jgi:hypothetical protein
VSKHVTLLSEMSALVDQRHLMTVSEVEQDLSSTTGGAVPLQQHFDSVLAQVS